MFGELTRAFRALGHLAFHCRRLPKLFVGVRNPPYSEEKRKGIAAVIIDYLYLFFVLGMLPRNYKLWQFDTKKRREFKAYLDEPDSPFLRRRLYSALWNDNYSMLVNDKYIFHCYCRFHHIATPRLCGVFHNGRFIAERSEIIRSLEKGEYHKFVIKPARGIQGTGIHFVSGDRIISMLEKPGTVGRKLVGEDLEKGDFIVEEFIEQHSELHRLNPTSVNTIRIITLLTAQMSVVSLAGMLRTSSSEKGTDNFSTGGIVVGIDIDTGTLKERGFLKPGFGTTVETHPVTNVRFKGFRIPFWHGVCRLAEDAQRAFYYVKSIGWDIAITETGPVVIEGNIEWGTAGIQATNGGLLTPENRELFAQYGLRFYR